MRLFRHDTVAAAERGAVVAIGNFDGVHLGHQAVIGEAGRIAGAAAMPHAVLTFEPHPRRVFRPNDPPFRLTPFRAKSRHLEALGVDLLFTLHFDLAFAAKSAEDFIETVLVRNLGVRHAVVGYDFVFGHQRHGTPALLQARGAAASGRSRAASNPAMRAAAPSASRPPTSCSTTTCGRPPASMPCVRASRRAGARSGMTPSPISATAQPLGAAIYASRRTCSISTATFTAGTFASP